MDNLPITLALATGLSILLFVLSVMVIKQRRAAMVSLGTGDDAVLTRRSRAHGNLTEYAPLFVIMAGLGEAATAVPWLVGVIAAAFMLGRVLHAYALAFTAKNMMCRVAGMVLTFAGLAAIILHNLALLVL